MFTFQRCAHAQCILFPASFCFEVPYALSLSDSRKSSYLELLNHSHGTS